ncbi:2,3-bisphosphoglycerate-independent phosphoglycerate mutase [Ilumatobacter sp.]|uniref:2,3-bisphosphoglycerate-independent phosphoglycerate mutase n=1 Tax=Ilumatobacter sp. TaxID=1967498 RepID=UPI003B5284AB
MEPSLTLRPHPSFTGRPGPLLVVVADGVGVAPPGASNAVTEAETPTIDRLTTSELSTELAAHGPAVGLPSDDDMGNSEVGHNALGAGRVFAQGAKLVNRAIETEAIFASEVWSGVVDHARTGTLHLIGLHSDGGVHSSLDHLDALLRRAAAEGVARCRVHILHDGRDVEARSALEYIARTEAVLDEIDAGGPGAHTDTDTDTDTDTGTHARRDFRIASGGGRMTITMDRYEADWAMVERGYRAHVHGEGRRFRSAADAVRTMYAESETGDQYLGEFVVVDEHDRPVGEIVDGDGVVFFNFRGDRAIEISRALEDADFDVFDRTGVDGRPHPDIAFAGMLQYDGDALVPERYLVAPPAIDRVMGQFLCATGVRSFAISETQKFGHVTYFWNGNRSGYIDESLETYVEIPSDNVEFDATPAMKVREITDETIDLLRSGDYRFGRLNFPSGDMVGHTGVLPATIEAMTIIDECLARLVEVIDELDGILVFTADHGNADIMFTERDGERAPKTSHTLSPVPFAIHDPNHDGEYRMAPAGAPGLGNVAATVLELLGYRPPDDYLPALVEF